MALNKDERIKHWRLIETKKIKDDFTNHALSHFGWTLLQSQDEKTLESRSRGNNINLWSAKDRTINSKHF